MKFIIEMKNYLMQFEATIFFRWHISILAASLWHVSVSSHQKQFDCELRQSEQVDLLSHASGHFEIVFLPEHNKSKNYKIDLKVVLCDNHLFICGKQTVCKIVGTFLQI